MTKRKTFKSRVRARMKKTGESYRSALAALEATNPSKPSPTSPPKPPLSELHVADPPGSLLDFVQGVIELAEAANLEQEATLEDLGIRGSLRLGSPQAYALSEAPHPGKDRLRQCLNDAAYEDVLKLQTLMYFGRDVLQFGLEETDDIRGLHEHLVSQTRSKDEAVGVTSDKAPLPRYLRLGLEGLATRGLDLETAFDSTVKTQVASPVTPGNLVLAARDWKQAFEVREAVVKFLGLRSPDTRWIRRLRYVYRGSNMRFRGIEVSAEVGRPLPFPDLNQEPVALILQDHGRSGVFHIALPNRGVIRGASVMVGLDMDPIPEFVSVPHPDHGGGYT